MLQSKLFSRTKKEAPSEEVSKSAKLLIQAGFIHKEMAGVYAFLPLGLRVVNKISNIIREEMNALGAEELKMTVLQDPEPWQKSGRWSGEVSDAWFKTKLKNDSELGLGWTHEEPLTRLMAEYISSYKDLPLSVYQIQVKLRNETRAKSGLLRGREFLMKDMYSFCRDQAEHDKFYEQAKEAYRKVFARVGLGDCTYLTFASGGAFSKYSHEFQTISPAGEDTIYVDKKSGIAINKEVLTDKKNLIEERAIEVGNIFTLGTRFSEPLGLFYTDEKGEKKPVFMGSYGIGPTRLMGAIAEIFSDDKGLIWPSAAAPFLIHLLPLGANEAIYTEARNLYDELNEKGFEVLLDDRKEVSAGEKFADADLIGVPWRIVVSEKSLKEGGVEVKKRTEEKGKIYDKKVLQNIFK